MTAEREEDGKGQRKMEEPTCDMPVSCNVTRTSQSSPRDRDSVKRLVKDPALPGF